MSGYRSILVRALNELPENTGATRSVIYQRARVSLNKQMNSRELQLSKAQMNALRMELENSIREVESEAERLERSQEQKEREVQHSRLTELNSTIHDQVPQRIRKTEKRSNSGELRKTVDNYVNPEMYRKEWKMQDIPGFQEERQSRQNFQNDPEIKNARKLFFLISVATILLVMVIYTLRHEISDFFNADQISDIALDQGQNSSEIGSDSQESLTDFQLERGNSAGESLSIENPVEKVPTGKAGSIEFQDESGSTVGTIEGFVNWSVRNLPSFANGGNLKKVADAKFSADGIDLNISFQTKPVDETSETIQIDLVFNTFDRGVLSNIAEIEGVVVNSLPESLGDNLSGVSEKIAGNHYRITLAAKYHACNFILLMERNLMDIPISLNNGSRAVVRMEKGEEGRNSFDSIYTDWQNSETASFTQCSILYEESGDSDESGLNYFGEAVWYAELKKTDSGREVTILKVDANFEDRGLKGSFSIMPEEDNDLGGNHLIEIRFWLSEKFQEGGIANIKGLYMKSAQDLPGRLVLTKASAKVFRNYFWVILSPETTEEEQNFNLLSNLDWLEIHVEYENGKRSVITIDKGLLGQEVINSAILAWKRR